mmetsp:Transcript_107350/g.341999  ORF Transcript_107350/g.341999 Transcript_107350/m.341999 type:complete len:224 (+) Transcript_107350:165-836(+)
MHVIDELPEIIGTQTGPLEIILGHGSEGGIYLDAGHLRLVYELLPAEGCLRHLAQVELLPCRVKVPVGFPEADELFVLLAEALELDLEQPRLLAINGVKIGLREGQHPRHARVHHNAVGGACSGWARRSTSHGLRVHAWRQWAQGPTVREGQQPVPLPVHELLHGAEARGVGTPGHDLQSVVGLHRLEVLGTLKLIQDRPQLLALPGDLRPDRPGLGLVRRDA